MRVNRVKEVGGYKERLGPYGSGLKKLDCGRGAVDYRGVKREGLTRRRKGAGQGVEGCGRTEGREFGSSDS